MLPKNINPKFIGRKTSDKKVFSVQNYVEGILKGNRFILSRAITLIESTKMEHREMAQEILEKCLPHSGKSIRVGITGTPGAGKSTFIERLGIDLLNKGNKLAVLTIDPTSQRSKGSILGDKTRMHRLGSSENAFIRPSPAGSALGGVAQTTREAIPLCEAAGFDIIIVETVGVGQSEIAVHSMVDFFLLLLIPGGGDELQGIKRGIVEVADLLVINKADGDRVKLARQAKRAYQNAIHLFPPKENQWTTKVLTCSSMDGVGLEKIWESILEYQEMIKENGFWEENRKNQARFWFKERIQQGLEQLFYNQPNVKSLLLSLEQDIISGRISSLHAAELLLAKFQENSKRAE